MTRFTRRSVVATTLALPLLALPGCTGMGGFDLTEAIRRMLTLSSQRAFATLLQPNGFYDDQLARVDMPDQIGGSRASVVVRTLLASSAVRTRLLHVLNDAAATGAERAAPLVSEAIRNFSVADAYSIIHGGGDAATQALRGQLGERLVTAMFPEIGTALRIADDPIVGQVLQAATGIDVSGLGSYVAQQAENGIYAAMGREEVAIRANPRATGDPAIIGAFGLLG